MLIAGHVGFEIVVITATCDGKFLFTLNFDRIELYRFLGWLCADKFFAKVFAFGFLLSLLFLPLLVFEFLDHIAAPSPKACPVEHLGEE